MTNNEVLKKLQETLKLSPARVVEIFHQLNDQVTEVQVSGWIQQPKDSGFVSMKDIELSLFLNALICELRGKKEGPQPPPENDITNNIIAKKLKIALDLKNEDIQEILSSVDITMNSYELTSYFRKPGHKNYRPIKDTVLLGFFRGLVLRNLKFDR